MFFACRRVTHDEDKAVVSVVDGGLRVVFEGGKECTVPATWLADQCRCDKCFHTGTLQRLSEDSVSVQHSAIESIEHMQGGTWMKVNYASPLVDHSTLHPLKHLLAATSGARGRRSPLLAQGGGDLGRNFEKQEVQLRSAQRVMAEGEEKGVLEVLEDIDRQGYSFLEGLEPTEAYTRALLSRIGFLHSTIFGEFWNFTVDTESSEERLEHADTAYTGLAIEPHTDGSYALEPPGLQAFHVLSFSSEQQAYVDSLLVDGFAVAKSFELKFPREYRLLCDVELDWKYFDPGRSHLHCRAPVITLEKHDPSKIKQIRWNHYDRGDLRHLLTQDHALLNDVYDAIAKWRSELLRTKFRLTYTLIPGRLVIFDNWRVLHGRSRFRGKRTLCGCYHGRQLFLSRLSVLRKEDTDRFT